MATPQLQVNFPSVGRVAQQAGNVLAQRENIRGLRTQNAMRDLQLEEFQQNAPLRKSAAEKAQELLDLDLSDRRLKHMLKVGEEMLLDLVGNTTQTYPAFLDKWSPFADMSKFPAPEQFEGSPVAFETLKTQAATSIEALQKARAGLSNRGVRDSFSKVLPDQTVRTIDDVLIGSEEEKRLIEKGFKRGKRTAPAKTTATERKQAKMLKATERLEGEAKADPNKFHKSHDFRMNDDGTLYIDPIEGGPVRLPNFTTATGKRGNIKAIIGLGEQMDDAEELNELLDLPSVKDNLKKASGDASLWDSAKGRFSNAINRWMQDNGIAGDSPTATAIARIQRMTSEERKRFMGTAVTENEIKAALAWMPSGGDSFESIVNKTRLMGQEAKQEFKRWLSGFENIANMAPFYKAFNIDRFETDLPEGLPSGSFRVGKSVRGNPVYQSPDGEFFEDQ